MDIFQPPHCITHMPLLRFVLLACLVPSLAFTSDTEDPSLKFFRDLAETRNYTLGRPVSPKLTPDGAHVVFLRAAARNPSLRLYEFTIANATERELLSPEHILGTGEEQLSAEEKARRERQRQSLRGFTSFEMSRDGTRLLVVLSGKLYVVNRSDSRFTELPGENWIDPRFSPDGQFVAAVKDRELFVIDLAANRARQITHGASDFISHGVSEFVAQEEMKRDEGYWWSPDSTTLLYQRTDESKVETRYIANALHPEEKPAAFAYPKAGSPNANVSLAFISRDGGNSRWVRWDANRYPYLARVNWSAAGQHLTILVQNREQTEQVLLRVDPATGETTELLKETDAAWLNLDYEHDMPVWLKDGARFIWTTERRGSWQVELRNAAGQLVRELTPVSFSYRGFVGVDETSGNIFVRGSHDPREVHLWRFPLTGEPGTPLTREPGHHSAVLGAGKLVHTFELFSGRSGAQVIDTSGTTLAVMRSVAETPPRRPTTQLVRTTTLPPFDAAITRPHDFDREKKYPVILYVYAGPTSKRVNALMRDYLLDQWMANQGYIVIRIDGRGTPWRGRDWERIIKFNFIDTALNDQIAGLQALAAEFPELDLSRVGVTGWSWGGYFSAMAVIRRPDIFRAGVAGAPVITWENYDTHYTERYLGLPQDHPEAYRVSNVTTYVDELRRPLMLIHGMTDDNVYFQHTLQLAEALFMAGKPYELLPMLGTHMISDPLVRLRRDQRLMDLFHEHVRDARD